MTTNFPNLGLWTEPEPSTEANGIFTVDPSRVNVHSKYKYRHRIDAEHVNELADEFTILKERDIIPNTVILVVPSDSPEYEWDIVYGAHRVMAGRQANTKLYAQDGGTLDELALMRAAIAENLLRKDPNELEYTEAILKLIELETGFTLPQVRTMLNWDNKGQKGANIDPRDWERLSGVLQALPKPIAPTTLRKHYLPLLSLPEDVSEAVRSGQLDYTKALALRSLDPDMANKLAIEAVEQELSLEQVKSRVKEIKGVTQREECVYSAIAGRLKRVKPAQLDSRKRKRLDRLLEELRALLDE